MRILKPSLVPKEQKTLCKVLNAERLPKNFAEDAVMHKDLYKNRKRDAFKSISFYFITLNRIELKKDWCYNY